MVVATTIKYHLRWLRRRYGAGLIQGASVAIVPHKETDRVGLTAL